MQTLVAKWRGVAKILVVILVGLLGVGLVVIKLTSASSPAGNPDFDKVIHLVEDGILKPEAINGYATLPLELAYLTVNGYVSVHTSVKSTPDPPGLFPACLGPFSKPQRRLSL